MRWMRQAHGHGCQWRVSKSGPDEAYPSELSGGGGLNHQKTACFRRFKDYMAPKSCMESATKVQKLMTIFIEESKVKPQARS